MSFCREGAKPEKAGTKSVAGKDVAGIFSGFFAILPRLYDRKEQREGGF